MVYDLNATQIFVEVVTAGSFIEAARRLRIPASTVSDRIAALEEALGVTLLVRTTRSMQLSGAGERFFERCVESLQGLTEAFQEAAEAKKEPTGVLRLSVPAEFAIAAIAEAVAEYRQKFPQVVVELHFSNEVIDFQKDRIDLALRGGQLKDSSLVAKRLGTGQQVLVSSAAYMKRVGTLRHPAEVKDLACIVYANLNTAATSWTLKNRKGETVTVKPREMSRTNSFSSIRELVRAGQGIAFFPKALMRGMDGVGLVPVLEDWASARIPVQLLYPRHRMQEAKVKEMIPILAARISKLLVE